MADDLALFGIGIHKIRLTRLLFLGKKQRDFEFFYLSILLVYLFDAIVYGDRSLILISVTNTPNIYTHFYLHFGF